MQGDHEELRIFLKNRLIPSRFNQELLKRREYISFYRKFPIKNAGHLIWRRRSDDHHFAKFVGHDPTSPRVPPV